MTLIYIRVFFQYVSSPCVLPVMDVTAWLTGHLQQQSSAAVVLHPDEAGVATLVGHHHPAQPERGVAQGQLGGEQAGAVGEDFSLVCQLVVAFPVAVHAAFGVCQLPEDGEIRQVEGRGDVEGAVEDGVPAM